jgi:HK97 gp10 family phage protein
MARRSETVMEIEGLDELLAALKDVAPREARNLSRAVVHGVAAEGAKRLKSSAPSRWRGLKRGFVAIRRRGLPDKPVSEVRVNRDRAFYWHWVEFGTQPRQTRKGKFAGAVAPNPQPFIVPTVERMRAEQPEIYREQFARKLEQALARKAARKTRRG